MRRALVVLLIAFSAAPARAAPDSTTSTAPDGQQVWGTVLWCRTGDGVAAQPCGTRDHPLPAEIAAVAWAAPAQASIVTANTYQTLFPAGAARHGGLVTNLCTGSTDPVWVDITGATGTVRSAAAIPVYPASAAGFAPGALRFPGTVYAVTVYGPAGCPLAAFGG